MTRAEFEDKIVCGTWYDLKEFCRDYGYEHIVDCIYDDDERSEYIDNEIYSMQHNGNSWEEIRDYLNDLADYECDHWYKNDYEEWYEADSDNWEEIIESLIGELEEDSFFDDDEEEESSHDAEIEITDLFFIM